MAKQQVATTVEVVETALVAPSDGNTPRQPLWLSNLDLIVPKKHMPLIYYYPAPAAAPVQAQQQSGAAAFSPARLKAALAAALVPFYPLAGRLGAGPDGRPQIDCNSKGALFVVAKADLVGADVFDDYMPSPEVRATFVPLAATQGGEEKPTTHLAMFQVTFLSCGGVVLGTAINHMLMDGVGAFHFIKTWAGVSRGLDVAAACGPPPFHDRTLLCARRPPRPSFDHAVYSPSFPSGRPRALVARVYHVTPKLLADLKSHCGGGVSTYCAVAAHLWRCACLARGFGPGAGSESDTDTTITRLGVAFNVRQRLRPPLPHSFFGNAVVRDVVTARVGDLFQLMDGGGWSLRLVAETIRKAVDRIDDAFVRSALDYLELEAEPQQQGEQALRRQLMPESDLWAVSWLGMPAYDADFGCGAPRLVAPAQMFGIGTAYVIPRASRDDGIAVIFELEPQYVQCFEKLFYAE